MKSKGFTLIELLCVIIILSIIVSISFPKIFSLIESSSSEVDITTLDLIINEASLYLSDNEEIYKKVNGNVFCISLESLVSKDYLKSPIKLFSSDQDITYLKTVKATYNNGFNFELVDNENCSNKF